jgi:hypothetical protein
MAKQKLKKQKRTSGVTNKSKRYEEIRKCGEDPRYFIKNYIKISHPTKGLVKFDLFPYQEECLEAFLEHKKIIVNKSRQLGLSTISAAYSLWMAIFHRERNILVVATKLDVAKNFIRKVKANLEGLPDWLVLPKLVGDASGYLQFSNGSQIKAIATSSSSGRSESLSLLVIDEAAHIEGVDDLWLAIQPTLSTGGSAILISSPSGVGTLFHKLWVDAKTNPNENQEGKNGFFPIELPWTVHPERTPEWFEQQKAEIIAAKGERGIGMELLCSFASSGDTFLKGETMDTMLTWIKQPEHTYKFEKDDVWVWAPPEPECKYVIGADVSRGNAEDYSTFHIVNIDTCEVVADFRGKLPPDKFAQLLITYGYLYNTALICQELNNVGVAAAIKLKNEKYPKLFYEKVMKNGYMNYNEQDIVDELPGFTTKESTRIEMLAKLENALRNEKLKVFSKRLYEEFQTFIWKGNKPQAQKGYNDDMVLALAIACQMFETKEKHNPYGSIEDAMAMLKGLSRESVTLNSVTGQQDKKVVFAKTDDVGPIASEFSKMMETIKKNDTEQKKVDAEKNKRRFYGAFAWLMDD